MNPTTAGSAYLGVDLGTSGLKLTLVADDGTVTAEAEASYHVLAAQPGHAETDPAEWAAALDRASRDLFADRATSAAGVRVSAIGVTGQMHGVVLVGPDGHAVRPALLWPDQRAAEPLTEWTALPAQIRARLANPVVAGMAGPLLAWVRAHEPESLAAASLVTCPKDWLRGLLTGDCATERSDASATLLWDVSADDWSSHATALTGVTSSQLPDVVPSDQVVGTTTQLQSVQLQIGGSADRDGVPVVAGGADTACALTALKATRASECWRDALVINLGTGIQILRPDVTPRAGPEPATHLYADADGGWYQMLAVQNGGFALSWVQAMLDLSWNAFVATAKESTEGSAGATFVPFLTGERGAVAPVGASAGWSHLTPSVGRPELARSAFEGLAFTIRRGIETLDHPGPVLLSGGGAREPWVRQLIADVLGQPIRYVNLRSASAVGAAVLAARGVGVQLPVHATRADVDPSRSSDLDDAYARWISTLQERDALR